MLKKCADGAAGKVGKVGKGVKGVQVDDGGVDDDAPGASGKGGRGR